MDLVERFKLERIAVNCRTEEEAKSFVGWCNENGIYFGSGIKLTQFEHYIDKTCYSFDIEFDNNLGYSHYIYYESRGYKIVTFDEFFKGKINMIKVKDIVEKYGDYEIDESKLKELLVKPKPKTIWDLKPGDKIYAADIDGTIACMEWEEEESYIQSREMGMIFLTKQEAEFDRERKKIETELLRYGGTRNMMFLGKEKKRFIEYNHGEKKLLIDYYYTTNHQGVIYFKSVEDCQNAIKQIGEDRIKKYLFHVEE